MYLEISNPMDYHVGLYIRLSKEDENEGPSESVNNQRSMLEEFVKQHRLSVFDTYVDDGWSGTNFDRPDFQRLIADIEAKKVNMVITKDLSRLGRDYILTGHYMERYFPEHRVRYISLLDGIDTGRVWQCLDQAGLTEAVRALPHGLELRARPDYRGLKTRREEQYVPALGEIRGEIYAQLQER